MTWIPGLAKWEELPELCLGNSSYLLLELPFYAWPDKMIQEIYDLLLDREITPIFAHLERYTKYQKKSYLEEIIKLETPIQLSCTPLADFWQRRPLIKMLNQSAHCLFASDCHNMERRPPNLQEGMKELSRVCGMEKVHEVQYNAECLIQTMERYKF